MRLYVLLAVTFIMISSSAQIQIQESGDQLRTESCDSNDHFSIEPSYKAIENSSDALIRIPFKVRSKKIKSLNFSIAKSYYKEYIYKLGQFNSIDTSLGEMMQFDLHIDTSGVMLSRMTYDENSLSATKTEPNQVIYQFDSSGMDLSNTNNISIIYLKNVPKLFGVKKRVTIVLDCYAILKTGCVMHRKQDIVLEI